MNRPRSDRRHPFQPRRIYNLIGILALAAQFAQAADPPSPNPNRWQVGTPITTYWAGPAITDATAQQMKDGGFNLIWCTEAELDTAHRHGLRAQLHDSLLSPATLNDASRREALDALIVRVRNHPALYSYYIIDEPSAAQFPELGKLVSYVRARDPRHLAYINLFPTYASNEQLGTKGDPVTAYGEHLRQYVQLVQPSLISYDHYQFADRGDTGEYFLNLAMVRRAALDANLPFLNIVQACSWTPTRRVPEGDEMRYLVYTTLAYGAQGISYYVYCHPGHTGGIALADGTPTPIFEALTSLNREFVSIAAELQSLNSLAVYHAGMLPPGTVKLPTDAPFRFDPPMADQEYPPLARVQGALLGYFGTTYPPSHVVVVNLDYATNAKLTLVGPTSLETFEPQQRRWTSVDGSRVTLELAPGGGALVRTANAR